MHYTVIASQAFQQLLCFRQSLRGRFFRHGVGIHLGIGQGDRLLPRLYYGSYDLMLDASHRVRLPGEVREQLAAGGGEGLFLFVGPNGQLWLFPKHVWRSAIQERGDDEWVKFVEAGRLSANIDSRGRMVVPRKLRMRSKLSRELTLVGVMDHWELWDRSVWEANRDDLDSRIASIIEGSARQGL